MRHGDAVDDIDDALQDADRVEGAEAYQYQKRNRGFSAASGTTNAGLTSRLEVSAP